MSIPPLTHPITHIIPSFDKKEVKTVASEKKVLEELYNKGFKEGYQAGVHEGHERAISKAQEDIHVRYMALLENVFQQIQQVIEKVSHLEHSIVEQVAQMTSYIVQEMFPTLQSAFAQDVLTSFMHEVVSKEEVFKKTVVISVHPEMIEFVKTNLSLDQQNRCVLRSDDSLDVTTCHVHLDNGGIEYNLSKYKEAIIAYLEEHAKAFQRNNK